MQSVKVEIESAKLDKRLRDISQQVQIHERDTTGDNITVKIFFFMSAVYMPGIFVAVRTNTNSTIFTDKGVQSLYSMNFFTFDTDQNRIIVADNFWLFLTSWLPLTLLTGGIYLALTWFNDRRKQTKKSNHKKYQRLKDLQLPLRALHNGSNGEAYQLDSFRTREDH